jgi:uncharacterized small protein (DUF1192 family)
MDWDEPAAQKPAVLVGDNLSTLSIRELDERIATLEAEMARVLAEIAKKKAHEAAASAIFKS